MSGSQPISWKLGVERPWCCAGSLWSWVSPAGMPFTTQSGSPDSGSTEAGATFCFAAFRQPPRTKAKAKARARVLMISAVLVRLAFGGPHGRRGHRVRGIVLHRVDARVAVEDGERVVRLRE